MMTPKQKAYELVNNMLYTDIMEMSNCCAKQCALIAVDLLLEEIYFENEPTYWQEVKQEIEKL